MRLWHKDLIPYLSRKQLLAQWRECCAIASNIANKGTPNHLLVNKIFDYNAFHFWNYSLLVVEEMKNRGYKISTKSFNNFKNNFFQKDLTEKEVLPASDITFEKLFWSWHNDRYLKQCLYNLQEKYDCGGIPEKEWKKIENNFEF